MSDPTAAAPAATVLHGDDTFEVTAVDWTADCAAAGGAPVWRDEVVRVDAGRFESRLDLGTTVEQRVVAEGEGIRVPPGARHALRCLSATGRTLHVSLAGHPSSAGADRFHVPALDGLREAIRLGERTELAALRTLLDQVRAHAVSTHSPYFMNQLFAGVAPIPVLAEELTTRTKTTVATQEASPAYSTIEEEVVGSLGALIGWPGGARDGIAVSGGSAANFMAIHCARQRRVPDVKTRGTQGAALRVFVSAEAHYSFKKACVVLGLGLDALVPVPVDATGRMQTGALEALIEACVARGEVPLLVCATSGTTVLGAFDPIAAIAAVCERRGLWLHVDAAWGGPALFSAALRPRMAGIEQADSVTFDAHKLFGAELTSSFFLCRHRGLLLEANDVSGAGYLFHTEDSVVDRGRLSWQCGRKAEAVSFWAIWKSAGSAGLGGFVDRLLAIRDQAVAWIATQPRLVLVADPQYLNVCVRVVPPDGRSDAGAWSRVVREALKERDRAFVNFSTDENGAFLRLILAHPYLEFEHVRQLLCWALEVGSPAGAG